MKKIVTAALAMLATPAFAEPVNLLPVSYNLPDPAPVIGPPEDTETNLSPKQEREVVKQRNWRKVMPTEVAWQVLNVVDIAQTIHCVHGTQGRCYETNFVMGRHPSKGEIIGYMTLMSVVHYLIAREASELHPAVGHAFEAVTIGPKLKTVRDNQRLFKRLKDQ